MEENVLMTEETTPMEEANTSSETADETESTSTEEVKTDVEEEKDTEHIATEPVEEATFPIRYNHEDVSLTKEEAKRLAQLGMHYEKSAKETLDSLDYIATLQGKSVKELVEELVNGVDSAYREELIAQFGTDNPLVEEMLELRRQKNDKAYEEAKADRSKREKQAEEEAQKSLTTRLAEQFEAVRETFPEYDTVEKVPDTVIKRAMKSGDLEKEMFRYERSERMKVEAAKASEEKNKNENVGSVQTDMAESGVISALMKGLWG